MEKNEDMRIVAVGDDDQNIYTFRGPDSKYFERFMTEESATKYELIENYRSKKNLVEFTNTYVEQIHHRFKETPIVSIHKGNGNIRIINYKNNNFIVPFVNDILSTDLSGTTGILTKTNNEALQITGLLLKNGIPAKLIQSNDGFSLLNLFEIRSFIEDLYLGKSTPTISNESWNNSKRNFAKKHSKSTNYDLCKNLLVNFQETNPKVKYSSDFEVFITESKIEDFAFQYGETINVSTIHKAKGKEFDNVFLMLDGFNAYSDDSKRQLYVAMTRAKQNLTIHYNGDYLNHIQVEELYYSKNTLARVSHLLRHYRYN